MREKESGREREREISHHQHSGYMNLANETYCKDESFASEVGLDVLLVNPKM